MTMKLNINRETYEVAAGPERPLLWVLRDELGLTGTKFGCGIGVCGSCTVHIDGEPTRTCITPLSVVVGTIITTIEGLATTTADGQTQMHPVQQAFLEGQVPQCGWCMSGQMMTAAAFLIDNPNPTEDEIIEAMSRNYCRCGSYVRLKSAVARAAELIDQAEELT